jgi:hypothetical protein
VSHIRITAAGRELVARLEEEYAPATCAYFRSLLPWEQRIIHVRWSGESMWIPLGDTDTGLPAENQTSHPAPGQVLLYPGGASETELLFPYGGTMFASIVGQLAGNHFLTVEQGHEHLRPLGERCLWEGAQPVRFDAV